MGIRTDLISERREMHPEGLSGVQSEVRKFGAAELELIKIEADKAAQRLEKPKGKYYTISFPPLENMLSCDDVKRALVYALGAIAPKKRKSVMVAGLGNARITPDSLGPKIIDGIFATRHIDAAAGQRLGLEELTSVSAVKTGVLGETGIESADAISAYCKIAEPDMIIVADALAARRPERLCRTIQLSDSGIVAGSGVGNARRALNRDTLGVPIIALGVPAVIDASTYRFDCGGDGLEEKLFVTPKDIDLQIDISSRVIAEALNEFLQPSLDSETIKMLN